MRSCAAKYTFFHTAVNLTHWDATVKEALKPVVVLVVVGGGHTYTCGDNIITCCLLIDLEVKSIEWD